MTMINRECGIQWMYLSLPHYEPFQTGHSLLHITIIILLFLFAELVMRTLNYIFQERSVTPEKTHCNRTCLLGNISEQLCFPKSYKFVHLNDEIIRKMDRVDLVVIQIDNDRSIGFRA